MSDYIVNVQVLHQAGQFGGDFFLAFSQAGSGGSFAGFR
jgi:hypothetical protein